MTEPTLLIVDDDPGTCETLSDIFQEKGYTVATATTGRGAQDKAKQTVFNVALIDIKLPDVDGTALLSEFRKTHPDIVCMIITGHASVRNAINALEEGADGYFVKPLIIEEIVHRVEETVDKQRLVMEKRQAEEALRKSEEKYRDLAELLPEVIFETDLEGNITYANQIAFDSFGYIQSDFDKGLNTLQMLIPEDRDRGKENIQMVLSGETIGSREYTAQRKDKTTCHIIINSRPIIHENKPVGLRGVITDITERKRAEEEIEAKSLFLESLIQQSPLPTFVMDSKGFVVIVNEAFLKFYAVPNKEMILGRNALTEPANVKQGVIKYFREALKGKIVEMPEMEFVSPYKNKKNITRCSMFPILDPTGALTNVVVMQEDITERKQAEESLKASEEKYRQLAETAKDVIMVLDLKGNVKYINQEGIKLSGHSKEEILKMNVNDVLPDDKIPLTENNFAKRIAGDKSIFIYEIDFLNKKGNKIPVEIKSSLITEQGKPAGVLIIARDITERKRADEEVKKSRKFLDTIIEDIPDPIYIKDRQFRFVEVNKAFCHRHEVTKGEILGESRHRETDEKVFKTGKKFENQEQRYTDAEGNQHWTHLKKVPLTDESGKITHVLTISHDVTERKLAEDKIKASLKEKEVLLREIHHRVKNNLQVISSMLNMQARKAKDKNVIDSLLDSRSRIQTMSLIHAQLYQSEKFEQVEMGTAIRKLVSFLLQISARDKKNIASVVTAEGVILSISQAIPCGLIINELVSNALKHAFNGMTEGSIEVSMRELAGDKLKLTVKDNGVGIPEERDIYKTDTLGLKIVRTLAEEQLKGEMGLIRDKGTEFYVEFDKSITN